VQQVENTIGENDFSGKSLSASYSFIPRRGDLVGG